MKSIGNERLQSLRKRVRAVLLSGVLTATLVLSNMAGIFTEAVYAVSGFSGDISTSQFSNGNIDITGDATITIDSNVTISYLIIHEGVSQVKIKGNGAYTLTFNMIYAENGSQANLIIDGGKLVSSSEGIFSNNDIVINGGTVEVDGTGIGIHATQNVTINGGTVNVDTNNGDGINGGEKVTISGGTVKVGSSGAGIFGNGGVEITGGNIDVTSSGANAIAVWMGDINISGQSTVIKAVTSKDNYSAIQARNGKINISSPLGITSPKGGGISGDGSFIATSAGGNQVAKAVEIKEADTSGGYP